jgi:5'-nucleotidase
MKLLLENWRKFLKEQEGEYQIYCDMDGVLVDFVAGTVEHITKQLQAGEAEELKEKIGRDYVTEEDIHMSSPNRNRDVRDYMFKELDHHAEFWEKLPWMPGGKELWAFISQFNPYILTAPMGYGSEIGKQAWIDINLQPAPSKVFMSHDKFKWSASNNILIDDFTKNTIPWQEAGGIAILHTDAGITIKKLEELDL